MEVADPGRMGAGPTLSDLNIADGESEATITLRDPKGARKQPRLHVLPVQGRALPLFKRRLSARDHSSTVARLPMDRLSPRSVKEP